MMYKLTDYIAGEIFESEDRRAIYSIYQDRKEEYNDKRYPITTSVKDDTDMKICWAR